MHGQDICDIYVLNYHFYINYRPQNKELFNLYYASLQTATECIFSLLKHCFKILLITSEYNLNIQAQISAVLCALYNFICTHDINDNDVNDHNYVASVSVAAELNHPSAKHNLITQ